MKTAAAVLCLALAAPVAAEEVFLYVDPVHGVDAVGGGTLSSPFQTITFAITQAWHSDHTITPLPGVYSTSSGEVFPIQLPPSINVVGAVPCGVRIVHPAPTSGDPGVPVFQLLPEPGGSVFNSFGGLEVETGNLFAEAVATGASSSAIYFTGCDVEAPTVLDVSFGSGTALQVLVTDSHLRTSDAALYVHALDPAPASATQLDLQLFGSRLESTAGGALIDVSIAGANGRADIVVHRSALLAARTGLRIRSANGAQVTTTIEHALFHGLGTGHVGTGPIVEAVVGGGPKPSHTIRRSIFWGNALQDDLPGYDPASYTLAVNLFEDPLLVGVGGSITGDPRFVDPSQGDWHLGGGSPAIDAGGPAPRYEVDWDGDWVDVAYGGDGVLDLGPDEHYERYVYFHPAPALGAVTSLRVFGGAGEPWGAYLGPISYWPGFGGGIQLQSLYLPGPFASGVIPPGGLAMVAIAMPTLPALAGFPFMCQAAYLTSPSSQLEVSVNAYKGWLCTGGGRDARFAGE